MPTLLEVHGEGDCHICKRPKVGPGEMYCSYPHGRLPFEPVNPAFPEGFWSWKLPNDNATDSKD